MRQPVLAMLCLTLACASPEQRPTEPKPQPTQPEPTTVTAPDDGVYDVVVIGGGVAGLTTAYDLVNQGVTDILVVEARDRVGGRTYNQSLGDGFYAEAGGQWLGPTQTAALDLSAELGLTTFDHFYEGQSLYELPGSSGTFDYTADLGSAPTGEVGRVLDLLDQMAATVPLEDPWNAQYATAWDNQTVAQWVDNTVPLFPIGDYLDVYIELDTEVATAMSSSIEDVSLLWFLFYIQSAGSYHALNFDAQALRLTTGAGSIATSLATELDGKILLSSPVTEIDTSDSTQITVHMGDETVLAHRVVLAMMPSTANRINFTPDLPQDRALLMENWPTNGGGYKVSLRYDRPFWRDQGLSGMALLDGTAQMVLDNSPADSSAGILMAFVNENKMQGTPAENQAAVVADLVGLFGPEASNVLGYAEMNWTTETYTTGCVSPLGPGLLTSVGHTLRAPIDRIHWAGTETSLVWNGYIDGAIRSGYRASEEVRTAMQ